MKRHVPCSILRRRSDGGSGRYTRRDPFLVRGGRNRYSYAVANPLRFVDPPGLQPALPVMPPGAGRDPFQPPVDPNFGSGPWGERPTNGCCDQGEILDSIASNDLQIFRLDAGIPLEGQVTSFVISGVVCYEGGWCISESLGGFDPPMRSTVTDPCVVFCVRVHEWYHYQDRRPWDMNWEGAQAVRFSERPAYQLEGLCLLSFL